MTEFEKLSLVIRVLEAVVEGTERSWLLYKIDPTLVDEYRDWIAACNKKPAKKKPTDD